MDDRHGADERLIELVRENERLKGGLRACRSVAERSTFGGWRHTIAALANEALKGKA